MSFLFLLTLLTTIFKEIKSKPQCLDAKFLLLFSGCKTVVCPRFSAVYAIFCIGGKGKKKILLVINEQEM